ncbi:CPBP family intramembrane metalloprotease [Brevibacillus humidisoli]|uniref:CPBP family intramembrane glutamic endopeptidase n=1 Tax=Brevibacillus humidisoli TaxID=2895522 RepID=UPI001E5E48BF|nr:type II CAAX endopeptidase family protein [Brevibacillus humidisoli]UFJ41121.1 CPBP family intramembrane metalloprotease [Brevibacillus humidisoli]
MALILLMFGPTLMIFLGLQVMGSVPITFLLFYSWLFAVPLWELLVIRRMTLSETFRSLGLSLNRKNLYHGFFSGLFFFLTILTAGYLFHRYAFELSHLQRVLAGWNFSGDQVIWLMGIVMFLNPILEELYWRGYMWQKLRTAWSVRAIIVFGSLFYTLYHLLSVLPLMNGPYHVVVIASVFLAGVIWGYMRLIGQSLLGSIVSHMLADLGIMAVYGLFLR